MRRIRIGRKSLFTTKGDNMTGDATMKVIRPLFLLRAFLYDTIGCRNTQQFVSPGCGQIQVCPRPGCGTVHEVDGDTCGACGYEFR